MSNNTFESDTSESLNPILRVSAGSILLLIASYGFVVNAYVFKCFVSSSKFRTDFYIFCTSRTISNLIACLVFSFWPGLCTIFGRIYLPHIINKIFGQTLLLTYVSGLLIQWIISINRLCVSYWPMGGGKFRKKFGLYIGLSSSWTIAVIYASSGLRTDCSLIFDITILSWMPEDAECAYFLSDICLYFVLFFSTFSNILNVFTFAKLFYDAKKSSVSLSSKQNATRQRKRIQMFAQSCTQDLFYVIDMTSGYYLPQLNTSVWISFLTLSVSLLFINALDGTVMALFNKEIRPKLGNKPVTMSKATISLNCNYIFYQKSINVKHIYILSWSTFINSINLLRWCEPSLILDNIRCCVIMIVSGITMATITMCMF